jgi:hypothetical protein
MDVDMRADDGSRSRLCWLALLGLAISVLSSGCYYHAMGGPALATAEHADGVGGNVTVSTGVNGERGGVGVDASGTFVDDEYSGMLGVEALRLWRGGNHSGLQPFARGGLGLLELGAADDELLFGGLSPRGEVGLMWLDDDLKGVTLSLGAEYRLRTDGLSTPLLWIQVGFGLFDFMESSTGPER